MATSSGHHEFGGDWTTKKLGALEKYLAASTTALKKQPFTTVYIDAFAGTGTRKKREGSSDSTSQLLFPELAAQATSELLDGSARIALRTTPAFSRYLFIDRDAAHCAALEQLKAESSRPAAITVERGDANEVIQRICRSTDWRLTRAVLFLDPYGMQVEWETIEAVAATRAVDMWLLFPLGIGVNRLLKRDGDIPESWRHRLNVLLGTHDWESEFYRVETTKTLFGGDDERIVKASVDVIGKYFNDRLRGVFDSVSDTPAVLRNSTGSPLYLFCFAAANPKGAPIAMKIANHILKELG